MTRSTVRKQPAISVPSPNIWPWLIGLLLIGVIAYANSFGAPLVFDDFLSIQINAGVRFGDYLSQSLLWSRSLLYVTFALNYLLGGQNVWGYHAVNLILHLCNGLLVFAIARRLFAKDPAVRDRSIPFAFLAAAVFVVHPIQTESVTYISSRSELFSTFFYALALLVFICWPEKRIGFLLSLLIAGLFVLGLGGKETVISLPAVLLLYDFLFISNCSFKALASRWRFYLTFSAGALYAAYYLVTRVLKGSIGSAPGLLPPWHYFLTQLRAMVTYIRLLFLPVGLNLDHDFRPSTSIFDVWVIASLLTLSLLACTAWHFRRRQPILAFSIAWFFLTLAPTSSFVPVLDVFFEHRLYLPLVGVCLSFPLLVDKIAGYVTDKFSFRLQTVATSSVLVVALVVGTIMRNDVWADEVRLWTDVVSKSPHKSRAYNALGMAYYKQGQYEQALEANKRGMQSIPKDRANFLVTMGNLYFKLNRFDDAVQCFLEVADKKRDAFSYNNLGVAYMYQWNALQGMRSQLTAEEFLKRRDSILGPAARAFLKSLESDAGAEWALDSYINAMFDWGKVEQIPIDLKLDLTGKSDLQTLYAAGKVSWLKNDYREAVRYFEQAEELDHNRKLVFYNHAYALDQLGQTDQAIETYTRALKLDPVFIEAHHNVALLYMKKQQWSAALEHFEDVLRMDPNHVSTNRNMAKIYIEENNLPLARRHLQIVLTVAPGDQEAAALLQRIGS